MLLKRLKKHSLIMNPISLINWLVLEEQRQRYPQSSRSWKFMIANRCIRALSLKQSLNQLSRTFRQKQLMSAVRSLGWKQSGQTSSSRVPAFSIIFWRLPEKIRLLSVTMIIWKERHTAVFSQMKNKRKKNLNCKIKREINYKILRIESSFLRQ